MANKNAVFKKFNQHARNRNVKKMLRERPQNFGTQQQLEVHKDNFNENNENISKGEDNMTKESIAIEMTATSFLKKDTAIKMTLVGCGNAGSRAVDELAKYRNSDNKPAYNCLAINSNEGDLKVLKNISNENRINLDIGGMGKNPRKGLKTLETNENVKSIMHNFVTEKISVEDDMVVFFAGLGGGTGTSTILKLVEDFNQEYNEHLLRDIVKQMIEQVGREEFAKNQNAFIEQAREIQKENTVKIGIVAFLPDYYGGAAQLEVVNEFAQKLWGLAKPKYSETGALLDNPFSFIMFPDNQFFTDQFKNSLTEEERREFGNALDFANRMVASTIHELNTLPIESSEKFNLDGEDFRTLILEQSGCLVISKKDAPAVNVQSSEDIVKMFCDGLTKSHLHSEIELFTSDNDKTKQARIFSVGINAIIDEEKVSEEKMQHKYGAGGFIADGREALSDKVAISGTVFDGYTTKSNNGNVSTYTIFKTDTLPVRLKKGLVEEYHEHQKRMQEIEFVETEIATIQEKKNDGLASLKDLGLEDLLANDTKSTEQSTNDLVEQAIGELTAPSVGKEKSSDDSIKESLKGFKFTTRSR
ncbi:cell division protein FtsZ [Viridibacillus arvi]|uniref:cell division protein FtsZ n=1 Tax=Viridibacillus arvi TaxID=263475 RepID=UPI0034D018F5